MLKKMFSIILTITLTLSASASASAVATIDSGIEKLSDMSELECLEFIKNAGVQIPNDFEDETVWAQFVKETIQLVEECPQYPFAYGYTVTQNFAEEIQDVVNEYYGVTVSTVSDNELQLYSTYEYYSLQDSSIYCSWQESFRYYNCYAFALRRTGTSYDPGSFSKNTFSMSLELSDMVLYIEADLHNLGYACVKDTVTRPIIGGLAEGRYAICFRTGPIDYHFMRMDSDAWYHKPTNTMPLKYNYLPATTRVWTNERVTNMTAAAPNTTYDSQIYFFIYTQKHNSYTYIGSGCHKIDCSYCGAYVPYESCSPVGNCDYCGS